jgi:hypothetical protein
MPVDKSVPGRRERRADTNVVSIDFSKLIAPSHMFTGDPVYCQQCKAILSHISQITKTDQQQVRSVRNIYPTFVNRGYGWFVCF